MRKHAMDRITKLVSRGLWTLLVAHIPAWSFIFHRNPRFHPAFQQFAVNYVGTVIVLTVTAIITGALWCGYLKIHNCKFHGVAIPLVVLVIPMLTYGWVIMMIILIAPPVP